jgi:hypothetical protein
MCAKKVDKGIRKKREREKPVVKGGRKDRRTVPLAGNDTTEPSPPKSK